ncbi:MAG TPA: hypothetical protein VI356_16490 [Myxococcales bacterium]
MAEKVLMDSDPPANDDRPSIRSERIAKADDPCGEGGFDLFCRDRHGNLCSLHDRFCHAPDYPCVDLLRHELAVSFLEEIVHLRAGERNGS